MSDESRPIGMTGGIGTSHCGTIGGTLGAGTCCPHCGSTLGVATGCPHCGSTLGVGTGCAQCGGILGAGIKPICPCNICKELTIGELVTVGTIGGTVLIGNVISNDGCTLVISATTITIFGLVITLPLGVLSTPILICCQNITFLAKTGLIIGG